MTSISVTDIYVKPVPLPISPFAIPLLRLTFTACRRNSRQTIKRATDKAVNRRRSFQKSSMQCVRRWTAASNSIVTSTAKANTCDMRMARRNWKGARHKAPRPKDRGSAPPFWPTRLAVGLEREVFYLVTQLRVPKIRPVSRRVGTCGSPALQFSYATSADICFQISLSFTRTHHVFNLPRARLDAVRDPSPPDVILHG